MYREISKDSENRQRRELPVFGWISEGKILDWPAAYWRAA